MNGANAAASAAANVMRIVFFMLRPASLSRWTTQQANTKNGAHSRYSVQWVDPSSGSGGFAVTR
jgi:hypothetical protein